MSVNGKIMLIITKSSTYILRYMQPCKHVSKNLNRTDEYYMSK